MYWDIAIAQYRGTYSSLHPKGVVMALELGLGQCMLLEGLK